MTTDVNVWMATMETIVRNKMTATLMIIVQMGQHVLMGATSTHVTVLMVTKEITMRNKMTCSPATIVPVEAPVLINMAIILAAAHHLGLECTANVLKNDMQFICYCIHYDISQSKRLN